MTAREQAIDLGAIKARMEAATDQAGRASGYGWAARKVESAQDVPALVAEVESLTTQLQAAQATIAAIRDAYEENDNWTQDGFQYRLDDLLDTDTSALAAVKAEAWDECLAVIEEYELNTEQARSCNRYRVSIEQEGAES